MTNTLFGLKKINDTTFESIDMINKEGFLIYLEYIKSVDSKVYLTVTCFEENNETEYELSETASDGRIISWTRYIDKSINTIYPIRLAGRVNKVRIKLNGITVDNLNIGIKFNSFYYV